MYGEGFHPLVFAVLCASVASTAIFAWLTVTHALNHRLQPRDGDPRYAWFTGVSTLNAVVVAATFVPMSASAKMQVFRLIWVFDILAVVAWVEAVTTFLGVRDRWLTRAEKALLAIGIVPAGDLVLAALTGHSVFFSPVPRPSTWPLLQASGNVYSHLPLADATALVISIVAGLGALRLLVVLVRERPEERTLALGVMITAAAVASEAVLGGSGMPIPLIFVANHLEAMRITWARTHALGADLETLRRAQAEQEALAAHQLQQLRTSQRLARVGEQTASITHDLRNPLGAALGGVELLEELHADPSADPVELREATAATRAALEHVMVLVRRVTRQARAEDEPRRVLALSRVLDDAISLARHPLGDIPLGVEVPPDLSVTARETGLVQVLVNLLANAAAALRDHPTPWIRVAATRVGQEVRITVVDAGRRPPDAVLDRMFTHRFTTRSDGTGLGLHICAQILAEHAGRIRVDRTAVHTTFVVELPALPADPATDADRGAAPDLSAFEASFGASRTP